MTPRSSLENRNRLSWWFPRLPFGIPVPKTKVIPYDGDDLIGLLDGPAPHEFDQLCSRFIIAGNNLGWPMFLRTDYLSGKHNWKETCCVSAPYDLPNHVVRLVEESAIADIMGFPTDRWIARKLIPTTPAFTAFHGDMPIVKERRYFVQDAQVICHHPYWPQEVFENTRVSVGNWRERLCGMNRESYDEVNVLSKLSSEVGAKIGGAWSIDWLWSAQEGRWYLTDMAEAGLSYHWPGCKGIKG